MTQIEQLAQVDIIGWCVTALLIMTALAAAFKIIEEFSKVIGKPVKWIKGNNDDHEAITTLQTKLSDHIAEATITVEDLRKKDDCFKKEMEKLDNSIDRLTNMFVDKQIADMRFDIVDVASAITLGRKYSVEQLTHVIRIYDDYERILKERKMTNGQVDMSIEVIKGEYRRLTQNQIQQATTEE